jgi:hypothetical protein
MDGRMDGFTKDLMGSKIIKNVNCVIIGLFI